MANEDDDKAAAEAAAAAKKAERAAKAKAKGEGGAKKKGAVQEGPAPKYKREKAPNLKAKYDGVIKPMLAANCVSCHKSGGTPEARAAQRELVRASRQNEPEKYRARTAVGNALRDGRLLKKPCFFCASEDRLQAHHEDYSRPLDVTWLCSSCHGKLHAICGDLLRVG